MAATAWPHSVIGGDPVTSVVADDYRATQDPVTGVTAAPSFPLNKDTAMTRAGWFEEFFLSDLSNIGRAV
jgi:hypothetical protein